MMKVSIITATYNSANTLRGCLDSVAAQQAISQIEHIIVDGRSTDSTLAILADYPHISQVVSQRDRGIYHAFNRGLSLASGDLVYFLNSDDSLIDTAVISDVLNAVHAEHQYYLGAVLCEDTNSGQSFLNMHHHSSQATSRPCHQAFFCRRELFEQLGNFNECFNIAADMYFMQSVMKRFNGLTTQRVIARFSLLGLSSDKDNYRALLQQHGMIDHLLGANTQLTEADKLALQTQNSRDLKQLMLNLLSDQRYPDRFRTKRIGIFGVRELSQIFWLSLSRSQITVSCFVVSVVTEHAHSIQIPVISLDELPNFGLDIVINCIEGAHQNDISAKIQTIAPTVQVINWQQFAQVSSSPFAG